VLKALANALLPAVRVFQMGGFGVGEFEVASRLAFVQAAAVQGRTKGGRTNVSRIAAMTGLTRKEVRQLLQILEAKGRLVAPSASRQRTARVLEAWRTDPLYLDDRGRPRVLRWRARSRHSARWAFLRRRRDANLRAARARAHGRGAIHR
jgi:hypothetical protein